MTHAYDEQQWAKIFKNEENLRDECVALLRGAASEQEFLNIFEMRRDDLCFSSGSLFFDQALDVLMHVVERNWLTAGRTILEWTENTQTGDWRLWGASISKASTTAMVDVFLERQGFPYSDQWMERFAKASTPQLFQYCVNQVRDLKDNFDVGYVALGLARQGLVDHFLLLEDLTEDHLRKTLQTACRHDQFQMIDFLYTLERAQAAMEDEKKFYFMVAETRICGQPTQEEGWMYLQAKMDREMINTAVGDGAIGNGRALKI